MPLTVGGRRFGPDPSKQLDRLADLWVEATETGKEVRRLESKMARQAEWLDGHRGDPLWGERTTTAIVTRKKHERLVRKIRECASAANKLAEQMDAETKAEAQRSIHEWATLGAVGIEAIAWDLIPDPRWLEEVAS